MKTNTIKAIAPYTIEKITGVSSPILGRIVDVDVFLPPAYDTLEEQSYPLLILNDGQDSPAVGVQDTLEKLTTAGSIPPIIVVGVYTSDQRMQEYGIAARADFRKRGSRAGLYTHYLLEELLPYIGSKYRIRPDSAQRAVAGYSLGGLSAFDLAWNHPDVFGKVGAFSASFWWRSKAYDKGYTDKDRIAHAMVRKGDYKPGLQFWIQTGTQDESADRNQNGIIDSIDDSLDLIVELTKKGYRPFHDIQYLEIKGGQHNPRTWGEAMPEFLKWAFGR